MTDQVDEQGRFGGIDFSNTSIIFGPNQLQPYLPQNIIAASSAIASVSNIAVATDILNVSIPANTLVPNAQLLVFADLVYTNTSGLTGSFDLYTYFGATNSFHGVWTLNNNTALEHLISWYLFNTTGPQQTQKINFQHSTLGPQAAPVNVITGMLETGSCATTINPAVVQTLKIQIKPSAASANLKAELRGYSIGLIKAYP